MRGDRKAPSAAGDALRVRTDCHSNGTTMPRRHSCGECDIKARG